jgi:hypothetical protein
MARTLVQRTGRLARVAALGLYAATLLPATGMAASERPLDFGAALLMPADVAQAGFEDYGIDSGRYFSVQQMIAEGSDIEPSQEEFEELGMESVHNLILHPIGGIQENSGPDITMVSFIYVYEDETHAEDGFAFLEDESDDPTATDLDGAPQIGDESEMTEYTDEIQDGGETYDFHGVDYSFRIGRVTATVAVNGWNEEVDRDDVEALGALLETKVLGVLNEGRVDGVRTPGLDSIAPRYEGDNLVPSRSQYCVLNGEALLQAYNPDQQASLQETVDDYGITAGYCAMTKLLMPSDDGAYALLSVMPTRFGQADDAERWVVDEEAFATADDSSYEDAEVLDVDIADLPFEADRVLAITFKRDLGGQEGYITALLIQQGRTMIDVRLQGYSAPELDVVIAVMADVVGCGESACYETQNAPAELLDYQAEQEALYAELD